jgi:hypothetical protein
MELRLGVSSAVISRSAHTLATERGSFFALRPSKVTRLLGRSVARPSGDSSNKLLTAFEELEAALAEDYEALEPTS